MSLDSPRQYNMTVDPQPQIPRVSATDDLTQVKLLLEEYGTVIIENLLTRDVVDRLNEELGSICPQSAGHDGEEVPKTYTSPSAKWTQYLNANYKTFLAASCKTFRHDVLNNPAMHSICEDVLTPMGDYWLLADTAMSMVPFHTGQQLHRDDFGHPITRHLVNAPPTSLAFLIALTPFTPENGATRVILGSHKWPALGQPSEDGTVRAVMMPGDAVIIRAHTVHGGSPDVAGVERRLLSVTMGTCQLTPLEAYMTLPRRIVECMTPLAQRMVGWRSQQPSIPGVVKIHNVLMQPLEDYLELKSDVPVEDGE